MSSVGNVELSVGLSLKSLLRDAAKAQASIKQQLKDVEVKVKPTVDSSGLAGLAKTLGGTYGDAQAFAKALGLTGDQAQAAIAKIQQLNSVGATTAEKFKALSSEFGLTATQMYQLGQAANLSEQQIENNSQAVAALANTLGMGYGQAQKFAQSTGLTAAKASEAVGKMRDLKAAGATTEEAFEALNRELGITPAQFSKLEQAAKKSIFSFDSLKGAVKDFSTGLVQSMGSAVWGSITGAMAGAAQGIKQTADQALGMAQDFNAAIAAANSLGADGEAVGQAMKDLSAEMGGMTNAVDLTAASYDVLSARTATLTQGMSDAEVTTEIMGAAVKGAAAGFSDVATISDALTSSMNSYKMAASEADSVTAKILATQNAGKITANQYAQQIGTVASTAAQAGVSLDELNGFIATATVSGVPVESTFSGIRQAIAAAMNPDFIKKAQELGLSMEEADLKTAGLAGIMKALNAQGLDTSENMLKLFGSVEALAAIAPSAGEGFAALETNIAASATALESGVLERGVEAVTGSVEARLQNSSNLMSEAFLRLGEGLLPIKAALNELFAGILSGAVNSTEAFDIITDAGQRIADTLRNNPELIEKIGKSLGEAATLMAKLAAAAVDQAVPAFQALMSFFDSDMFATMLAYLKSTMSLLQSLFALFQAGAPAIGFVLKLIFGFYKGLADVTKLLLDVTSLAISKVTELGGVVLQSPMVKMLVKAAQAATDLAKRLGLVNDTAEDTPPLADEDDRNQGGRSLGAAPPPPPATAPEPAKAEEAKAEVVEESADAKLGKLKTAYDKEMALIEAQAIGEDQIQQQKLARERAYLDERAAINQKRLEELNAIVAAGGEGEEVAKAQAEIAQLEQEGADAKVAIKKNEIAQKEALEDAALAKRTAALESELNALDARSQTLAQDSEILNAQLALQNALASLDEQRLQHAIAAAQKEHDSTAEMALQTQLHQQQQANLEAEFAAKSKQLEISQEQTRIDLEREAITARIAKFEAEAELAKARARGASADEIRNLEQQVSLRGQQVGFADQAKLQQSEIASLQNQQLAVEQQMGEEALRRQQIEEATALAKDAQLKTLDQQAAKEKMLADQKQAALDAQNAALQRQGQLLAGAQAVSQAAFGLEQQRLANGIKDAKTRGEREQKEKALFASQRAQFEQELAAKAAQITITERQQELELQGQELAAQRAIKEAEIAIIKAKISGASAEEVALLQESLGLAQQQAATFGQQRAANQQMSQQQRQALAIEGQGGREGLLRQQAGQASSRSERDRLTQQAQRMERGGMAGAIAPLAPMEALRSQTSPIAALQSPAPLSPQLNGGGMADPMGAPIPVAIVASAEALQLNDVIRILGDISGILHTTPLGDIDINVNEVPGGNGEDIALKVIDKLQRGKL